MRKAAVWTTAATGAGAMLQLLQLAIAARYLHPTDFGVLAIVNIVLWVVGGFQDMGLSSYCIHLGEQDRKTNSSLFWISTCLGGLAATVIACLAQPLQTFYAMPGLAALLLVLSLNFVLLGLSGQYQAHLIRVFRAENLAQAELCARVLAFGAVVVFLAVLKLGVLSVVLGHLVFGVSKLLVLLWISESAWHPRFEFDTTVGPAALKYGSYQAASVVVNQLRQQLDQIIIGKVLGAEALGLYSLAKELLSYPMRVIQPLISRLTLPRLAAAKNDPEALKLQFLRSLRLTANGSALVHVTLTLLSCWVVNILYGEKFISVVPMVALLSLFATLRPLGFVVGMLAQATGKTSAEFWWNVWSWLVTLPSMMAVALYFADGTGFSISMSITQVMLSVALYPLFMKRVMAVGFVSYLITWVPALLGTLLAGALVYFLNA
jgi:exopolysaccharide (amylovoran) exporter